MNQEKTKIGVLICENAEISMLLVIKSFINLISEKIKYKNLEIIFGASSEFIIENKKNELSNKIKFREISWIKDSAKNMSYQFDINLVGDNLISRPVDNMGGYDFLDCNYWILFGYPKGGTLAPIKDYFVIPSDLNLRYFQISSIDYYSNINEKIENYIYCFNTYRNAKKVFSLTKEQPEQLINLVGLKQESIFSVDFSLEKEELNYEKDNKLKDEYVGLIVFYHLDLDIIEKLINLFFIEGEKLIKNKRLILLFKKNLTQKEIENFNDFINLGKNNEFKNRIDFIPYFNISFYEKEYLEFILFVNFCTDEKILIKNIKNFKANFIAAPLPIDPKLPLDNEINNKFFLIKNDDDLNNFMKINYSYFLNKKNKNIIFRNLNKFKNLNTNEFFSELLSYEKN